MKKQVPNVFNVLGVFCMLGVITALVISGEGVFAQSRVAFLNVSDKLDFVHQSDGGEGLAGAVWFDYNNDGFLDLYLTNGIGHENGLFENNGDGTFTNVSFEAGVENGLGNSGVIAGDIDNDGHLDLFLTGEGGVMGMQQSPTNLYHSNGDGTFTDITIQAGVVGAETALSAAFADIDNDGFLDLFITSPESLTTGMKHRNKLYYNNGDLTFTDISEFAGVDTDLGACAAGFCDYDDDGWVDLFIGDCVARPTTIELFHNNGDLTFTNVTKKAGLNNRGFWMGFTFGDYDNDGDMDLFATNLGTSKRWRGRFWWHALYENNGDGTFTYVSLRSGVARWEFGWGCSFADFDNDGYIDLFFTGSFSFVPFDLVSSSNGNPGRLFLNNRDKTFTEVGSEVGFDLSDQYTSGVSVGDFDSNGSPDIVIAINTIEAQIGQPQLFQNKGNDNSWLTIRTVGTMSNRDGIGARVRVTTEDLRQIKDIHAGSSFLSMDSPWLTFGLAQHEKADMVEITWPSGLVEKFKDVSAGQMITIVEGEGIVFP